MGSSLRLLGRVAGSPWVDRAGLREPAELALREGARASIKAASALSWALAKGPLDAVRGEERREPTFDLAATEAQAAMQAAARRLAAEHLRPAAAAADARMRPDDACLEEAHALRFTSFILASAERGRPARSAMSFVLLAEALAHGDVGHALAILSPLSVARALLDEGTDAQRERFLPAFGGPQFYAAAVAVHEPGALFDPRVLRTRAIPQRQGFSLLGDKTLVPLGQRAELFLVAAEVPGVGPRLFLVPRGVEGLVVEAEGTMGLRSAGLCRLRFDHVQVPRDALLGGEAPFDYSAILSSARLAVASLGVGGAQAALDYVVPFCGERRAQDEPLGDGQATALRLADAAIELEAMRLLVRRAASRQDRGRDVRREAQQARIHASEHAMEIGAAGVQLLGGHGYSTAHPVERFYRDLRAVALLEGSLLA